MKFIRPAIGPPLSTERGGSTRIHHRRPQWLTEWIENKSRYLLLKCGHKENIAEADSAITLIRTYNQSQVYCVRCKDFSAIERSITMLEYHDIPKPVYPDTPPF